MPRQMTEHGRLIPGMVLLQKLASTGAKQVLEQASAGIASQVVGYVIPAIGALLTVAMLPHTYHKIHQVIANLLN